VLKEAGVAISMDGRGRCMDNIFIERLWRSLKYEAVYLHEMTDGFAAGRVIGEWIDFYNTGRPHSALDGATPREAYRAGRPVDKARACPHPHRPYSNKGRLTRMSAWQHDQQQEYTLTSLPTCPTNRDQLNMRPSASVGGANHCDLMSVWNGREKFRGRVWLHMNVAVGGGHSHRLFHTVAYVRAHVPVGQELWAYTVPARANPTAIAAMGRMLRIVSVP
jgi:hypothetical protein